MHGPTRRARQGRSTEDRPGRPGRHWPGVRCPADPGARCPADSLGQFGPRAVPLAVSLIATPLMRDTAGASDPGRGRV